MGASLLALAKSIYYNSYFGDRFWPKKNCWTQKVYLAITLSKIRLDIHYVI